jgi:hypothetical protein
MVASWRRPRQANRRPQRVFNLGATLKGFTIRRLRFWRHVAPPMQDWLPAGGLRLCRESLEPSGSLDSSVRKVPSSIPALGLGVNRFRIVAIEFDVPLGSDRGRLGVVEESVRECRRGSRSLGGAAVSAPREGSLDDPTTG